MHLAAQNREIGANGFNVIEACMVSASIRRMTDGDGISAADALESARSFDLVVDSFHRSLHTAQAIF